LYVGFSYLDSMLVNQLELIYLLCDEYI